MVHLQVRQRARVVVARRRGRLRRRRGLRQVQRQLPEAVLRVRDVRNPVVRGVRKPRRAFDKVHKSGTVLGAGTYATITGVQKCRPHGVRGAQAYEWAVYAAVGGMATWVVALELRKCGRAAGNLRRRGHFAAHELTAGTLHELGSSSTAAQGVRVVEEMPLEGRQQDATNGGARACNRA